MSKIWLRIISVLEIIGGVFGVGFVYWWLLATPVNAITLILAPIPVAIYVLSFVAGIALWRGSSFGRKASLVVQVIQVPKIVSPLIIFMFSFGLDFWVHMLFASNVTTAGFEIKFLAFNQFFINTQDAPFGLGVSVTAVIFLVMLLKHKPGRIDEAVILPPPPPDEWSGNPEASPDNGMQPTAWNASSTLVKSSEGETVVSSTQYPNLIELSGFPFSVYASPGTEQRARSIAGRCQSARDFLISTFEFEPQVRVLVLTPEDWSEYATFPVYGMPHYTDERTLAVAGQESGFWQSMSPPVEALPPEPAHAMKAAYGQPDGAINLSPFFDLLAVHELGHLFQFQGKCQFPRLWLAELFCNICLHAYTVAVEPEQLPALETFPRLVASLGVAELRYCTLDDFERLYIDVGPQNYGWYQCRFHVAAKHIYEEGGVEALERLWRAFLNSDEKPSDEQLATRLREDVHSTVAQVLTTWSA